VPKQQAPGLPPSSNSSKPKKTEPASEKPNSQKVEADDKNRKNS